MNKIFDYMAAARPIIIAMNAANNPVEAADAGITVTPNSVGEIADAIERLVNTPDSQIKCWGENGRRYVAENHDYKILASSLANILDDTLSVG
jgi:glycosyltransferase involved in cell wall biosynthesis